MLVGVNCGSPDNVCSYRSQLGAVDIRVTVLAFVLQSYVMSYSMIGDTWRFVILKTDL